MPYLTSTPAGTAGTGVRTGLCASGCAHPLLAPAEWNALSRPGTPLHWAGPLHGGPATDTRSPRVHSRVGGVTG
jgi:hypothetical protein